jgi:hypothetical protein
MIALGMKLRPALGAAAAAAVVGFGISGAGAAPVIANIPGPAELKYNGVTTEDWTGGTIGATTITNGNESTFGIGQVTTIQNIASSNFLFVDKLVPTGQRLFFVLYGIADAQVTGAGPFQIWNEGCTGGSCDGKIHIDFYAVPNATPDSRNLPNTNRTGFSTFTGITDIGTPIMKWTLDTGAAPDLGDGGYDESTSQLFQVVSSANLPATGAGNFFASCALFGGTDECAMFDTNGFTTNSGVQADFRGLFDLQLVTAIDLEANGGPIDATWDGKIHDPVDLRAIPEPATLGILGLAALSVGFLARRRKVA